MVLVVLQQDHLALELCLELVSRTGPGHECLFCYLPNSPCLLTQSVSNPHETQGLRSISWVHSPIPSPELTTSHILEFLQGQESVFLSLVVMTDAQGTSEK